MPENQQLVIWKNYTNNWIGDSVGGSVGDSFLSKFRLIKIGISTKKAFKTLFFSR